MIETTFDLEQDQNPHSSEIFAAAVVDLHLKYCACAAPPSPHRRLMSLHIILRDMEMFEHPRNYTLQLQRKKPTRIDAICARVPCGVTFRGIMGNNSMKFSSTALLTEE